jgi:hypothetical protein
MTARTILAAAISGAVVAAVAPRVGAGVVPISRSSSIQLDATAGADDFHDHRSTDQFGRFNESLSHEGTDPNGAHVTGSVSQDSTVDNSDPARIFGSASLGAHAFGEFTGPDVSGPVLVHDESILTVLFQITDQPERFKLDGSFGGLGFRGNTATFDLSNDDPNNHVSVIIGNNSEDTNDLTFARDFQIQPGNWTLKATAAAGSSGSSPGDSRSFGEDTTMDFTFSVGSAATAIPLPPGVWTGASGLLAALGAIGFSRRRRYV